MAIYQLRVGGPRRFDSNVRLPVFSGDGPVTIPGSRELHKSLRDYRDEMGVPDVDVVMDGSLLPGGRISPGHVEVTYLPSNELLRVYVLGDIFSGPRQDLFDDIRQLDYVGQIIDEALSYLPKKQSQSETETVGIGDVSQRKASHAEPVSASERMG